MYINNSFFFFQMNTEDESKSHTVHSDSLWKVTVVVVEPRLRASLAPRVHVGVGGGEPGKTTFVQRLPGHLHSPPPSVINLDPLCTKFPFLLHSYEIYYLDSSINNLNPQLRIQIWN